MRIYSLALILILMGCSSLNLPGTVKEKSSKQQLQQKKIFAKSNPEISCPKGSASQLNGFFQWYLKSQTNYRDTFNSQAKRFENRLFETLRQVFKIPEGSDGGLDFDPFSGSQLKSFGYWLGGCRHDIQGSLIARLAIHSGPTRPLSRWLIVDYVMSPIGRNWIITNIRYPDKNNKSLIELLEQ